MYISELTLTNFRGFKNPTKILFTEGTNVIIGHNNSGKTTVIKGLELLFDSEKTKRLCIHDFNKNLSIDEIKTNPPKITITAKLVESENEKDYSDDLVTVSTWLTKIEKPYEALITYEFFLPEKERDDYTETIEKTESQDINDYWYEIEYNFLQKYTYKVYVGNPEHKNVIEAETLKKFDFQFLTAIRDVERDLFTGRNSLLKEVIDFFIDYEIKTNDTLNDSDKRKEISARKKAFSKDAKELISVLQNRMAAGKKHMLRYAEETGAAFENLKPSFEGRILDTELYSALKLIVENETGIKLPANQNGLGYNNLIYISLLLARMQKNASGDYLGTNSKVFSMLAIEEPEAHLHPNMQYKFLKFLNENKENEVRQIFITSHSPNITAAVNLDDIIVLYKDNNEARVAYPGRVFANTKEDIVSKSYVQRFIDVTKADIFFAKNLILVEGIAEQLLLPEFATILTCDLTDAHVSVVNIGGRYFEHFLKLFDTAKSKYAIKKKIACITDLDPVRKKKEKGSKWKSCLPIAINCEVANYEYNACSNNVVDKYCGRSTNDSVRVYSQNKNTGCTFEYELILCNPTISELITDSVSNASELQQLMLGLKGKRDIQSILDILKDGDYKDEICKAIGNCSFDTKEKIIHLIAGRYLKSIQKGAVAQELAYVISENYKLKDVEDKEGKESFELVIPKYISEAIEWIYQQPLS